DWARTGLGDAFPFVVVAIVLVVMGRKLPERGSTVTGRLPAVPRGRVRWPVVTAAIGAAIVLLTTTSGVYRFGVISSLVFAFFTLSLVVVTGLVGQVSLAQAAVAGVGAFALVKATPGIPFPLNIVFGALVATVAGLIIGVPALRIRHGQLAVVTLAAAVAVNSFIFGNNVLNPPGQNALPHPRLFGVDFAVQQGAKIARLQFGFFVLVVLAVACFVVAQLTRGRWGRRFLAVRGDERAAAAAGVDVARTKLMAFALSSFLAGVGGALLAYSQGQAATESFAVLVGISFVVYAYLGGITSVTGALVAAAAAPAGLLYVVLNNVVDLGNWYGLVSGVGLLIAIVSNPQGAVGAVAQVRDRLLRGRRRPALPRPEPADPVTVATVPQRLLLDVHNLSVRYGGAVAVDAVSFQIHSGEIVGLIGANGAGKSSLIDAITGFVPASGDVRLLDKSLTRLGPAARARAGLARTWQSTALFLDLTVRDNVAVADTTAHPGDLLRDVLGRRGRTDGVDRALVAAGAWPLADQLPTQLSTGQQRTAALARALAGAPTVLLADEPAAGLDPNERPLLAERLRAFADSGAGVLLVEHDLELVLQTCDRVVVLDLGRVIFAGEPARVRSDPGVVAAYLGVPVEDARHEVTVP
ncbi:MAG TPA: ATP-binding cassette domain-containing protein, partial [Jatrophihabitantaceae bacterium]|nr:ATP-binding cassette domain-containing protein [Jatrophihabitantaceae bacterium]